MSGGDLLIHCGDMFNLPSRGMSVLNELDDWFGKQDFEEVICVGGNHDVALEAAIRENPQPFRNARLLQDDGFMFMGLKIYGSPWVPDLPSHAFSRNSSELKAAWKKIPDDTDILITHSPPLGILDLSSRGHSHGCSELAQAVRRVGPRLHCFGHVHASAGSRTIDGTHFVKASSIESSSGEMLPPVVIELKARC